MWIGTSGKNHDNVPEVWLDRFILAPDETQLHEMAYRRAAAAHAGKPTFALIAAKRASVTLGLTQARTATVGAFAMLGGGAATATVSAAFEDEGGGHGNPVLLATVRGFRELTLDLGGHAPRGWTGAVSLTFSVASDGERSAFSGVILSPSRRALGVRRVALQPPRANRAADLASIDDATVAETQRMGFEIPRRKLRARLPGAKFAVRLGSPLRKYLRHTFEPAWVRPGVGASGHIAAARHEYEGLQLVLIPLTDAPIERIDVRVDPMRLMSGSTPGAKVPQLQVNPVGYVKTADLRYRYATSHVGWWPDPLLPQGPIALPADGVQPVWITAYVPADAAPGDYRTVARCAGSGQTVSVPLTVRVRPFTLPLETHLRSSFWLFRYHIRRFYGRDRVPWELYKKYVDMATAHRLTPIEHSIEGGTEPYIKVYREPDGRLTFDYTEMDRYLSYVLDVRHGNAFNVGYACWHHSVMANLPAIDRATGKKIRIKSVHLSDEYVRTYTHFLQDYCAHLRRKGWLDRAYHQMIDEPRTKYLDTVKRLHKLSHDAVPDLKVLVTACWPPRLPDDSVDVWVPLTPKFKPEEAPAIKARGDETWWYVCCGPSQPYANFFIDYPATDHRILFWQSWKYGAQGVLYWGLNYWTGSRNSVRINWPRSPGERWPNAPWITNTCVAANGDGYLMYPGPDGTPLSSIRLEAIRDGMEDYEYLHLLSEVLGKVRTQAAAGRVIEADLVKRAEAILRVDATLVESMTSYTKQPEAITAYRDRVAEMIERLTAALDDR